MAQIYPCISLDMQNVEVIGIAGGVKSIFKAQSKAKFLFLRWKGFAECHLKLLREAEV